MGLTMQLRRLRHVWTWRARYWWMDTEDGARAHVAALCLAVLVVIVELIRVAVAALQPLPPGQPEKAIIWWVVQIILLIVSAAISYALRPKPENAKPQDGEGPTTEDGQSVIRYWGTCWADDTFQLAWKIVGRDPIKAKGGK
jgi:heme/copper-type cytochrome/quinol oxidase subunit 2